MSEKMAIMVATIGQGVMRSDDEGQSWVRVGIDLGMHSDAIVRCLASHPKKPEVVFAGTDLGLYRSDDAGHKWQLQDTPLSSYCVWKLAIDPQNPEIMYAGTGTPTPATMFRSDDKGASWEKLPIPVAETCINTGIPRFTGLEVDPADPRSIWAGIEVDGVRHSKDGGHTWETINGAIPNPDTHAVAVVAGPPRTVVVVVVNGIHTSTDAGASWKGARAQDVLPMAQPRAIAVQPGNPDVLFLGIGDSTPGRTGTVLRSRDLGQTWEDLPLPGQPNSAIWGIGVHPADPDIMFAVTRFGYLYRSNDAGNSWAKEWREFGHAATVMWVPM